MKKTLAAVLAAAMALSTATVAFATDHPDENSKLESNDTASDGAEGIRYGIAVNRVIESLGGLTAEQLAYHADKGNIVITPITTQGANKISGKPTVSLVRRPSTTSTSGSVTQVTTKKDVYTWAKDVKDADGNILFEKDSIVEDIPVVDKTSVTTEADLAAGKNWMGALKDKGTYLEADPDYQLMEPIFEASSRYNYLVKTFYCATKNFIELDTRVLEDKDTTSTSTIKGAKIPKLNFTVKDTYGTGDDDVAMKIRFTVKKAFTENGEDYAKGDTYTSQEFKFNASYGEIADHSEDMQITLTEVGARNVILNGGTLYDEIGANKSFRIWFEDVAFFEGKSSANQKKINLFYNLDEIATVKDGYPTVDFEFITFKGTPAATTFVNTGKMTFNAINGRSTQIYRYNESENALEPLNDATYDSTYNTITVSGIKQLNGTFVIASEIIEVEEEPEEPAEPVDSTPVAEPDEDEGGNPNTGAC